MVEKGELTRTIEAEAIKRSIAKYESLSANITKGKGPYNVRVNGKDIQAYEAHGGLALSAINGKRNRVRDKLSNKIDSLEHSLATLYLPDIQLYFNKRQEIKDGKAGDIPLMLNQLYTEITDVVPPSVLAKGLNHVAEKGQKDISRRKPENSLDAQDNTNVEKPRTLELVRNEGVNLIARAIANSPLDIDALVKKLIDTNSSIHEVGHLTGYLLEAHIALVLEELVGQHPEIKLDPIKNGQETENYIFYTNKGNPLGLNVRSKDRKFGAEYDRVLTVPSGESQLPVVIEAKMRGNKRLSLSKLLDVSNIEKKLQPFEEIFPESKAGYIVVVPKKTIRSDPHQEALRAQGGVLVEVPVTVPEFREYVRECENIIRKLPQKSPK